MMVMAAHHLDHVGAPEAVNELLLVENGLIAEVDGDHHGLAGRHAGQIIAQEFHCLERDELPGVEPRIVSG